MKVFFSLLVIACVLLSVEAKVSRANVTALIEKSTVRVAARGKAKARVKGSPPAVRFTGAMGAIVKDDAQCVMCQYIVQRIHAGIAKLAMAGGAPGGYEGSPMGAGSFPYTALLEVDHTSHHSIKEKLEAETSAMAELIAEAELEHMFLPRRYRAVETLNPRQPADRYSPLGASLPNPMEEEAEGQYQLMSQAVYKEMADLCAARMPGTKMCASGCVGYDNLCLHMLQYYRVVVEGLHYGDRPDEICLRCNYCTSQSYIRNAVHNAASA
jgi:hypothetical protein